MKKYKTNFTYKNNIILTNGSSLRITSVKFIKNYQLNINLFQKKIKNKEFNNTLKEEKINFLKRIKNY